MATHSSILAWRIPRTEEPGGLQAAALQSQIRLSDQHFRFADRASRLCKGSRLAQSHHRERQDRR